MILPTKESMTRPDVTTRRIFIYGGPYSGKSTFSCSFPEPFGISTDGNWSLLPELYPYIHVHNDVRMSGRIREETLAWEIFKDIVSELEKKDNEYRTIVVDLVDDLYEHCRLWVFKEEKVEHESDNSFKLYDKVRLEFLSTMKRLLSLKYDNIIIVSHEDSTKDLTKRSSDKVTRISPALNEKVSNKLAGYCDLTARLVNDAGEFKMVFAGDTIQFGGGRFDFGVDWIPLDYSTFDKAYNDAKKINHGARTVTQQTPTAPTQQSEPTKDAESTTDSDSTSRRRARRTE